MSAYTHEERDILEKATAIRAKRDFEAVKRRRDKIVELGKRAKHLVAELASMRLELDREEQQEEDYVSASALSAEEKYRLLSWVQEFRDTWKEHVLDYMDLDNIVIHEPKTIKYCRIRFTTRSAAEPFLQTIRSIAAFDSYNLRVNVDQWNEADDSSEADCVPPDDIQDLMRRARVTMRVTNETYSYTDHGTHTDKKYEPRAYDTYGYVVSA